MAHPKDHVLALITPSDNDLPLVITGSKPGLSAVDTGLTASNSDLQTLQDLIVEDLSKINTWLVQTNFLSMSSKLST